MDIVAVLTRVVQEKSQVIDEQRERTAMLTKVVGEQEKTIATKSRIIDGLEARVARLEVLMQSK